MVSYIITTDDYSVSKTRIDEIRRGINSEFDEILYDLEDDGLYQIVDELTTVSLFDEKKLVIVKSAEKLLDSNDKAFNELIMAMGNIQIENVLVFITTQGFDTKGDKKEKYDKLKKYSSSINIFVKNISLEDYAINECKKDNYTIDNDALKLLVSYSDSLTAIISNLDKLKSYKMEEKNIKFNDVKLLVPRPLDDDVFDLVNSVLKKDKRRVFEIYRDLKILSQANNLVALLINKFQELHNVYYLARANMSKENIMQLFNVSSGRAYYMLQDAKSLSINDIKGNLEYLYKLDLDIKSGKYDNPELGLELYFLR